jgi:predicted O-linked N-acetylglucosamine transferase (SPINDLY family)
LLSQGLPEEALEHFQRAASAKPNWARPRNHIAFALNFCPTYDARAMGDAVRQWVTPLAATVLEPPHLGTSSPTPQRRLRIGYLSPNFRHHCQAHFTVPLLAAHQHQDFAICCYADVAAPDDITARLRSYTDVWHSVADLNDAQIAERIRQDQIDILVDLTMHMNGNRCGVFARRPASVQVCWLAYPGTTGLPTIDFRLTDPYLDPPGQLDDCYTETSVRLPDSFWCYDPLTNEPQVNALPADSHAYITFGSLNNFCKVNDHVLRLWGEVLRTVADSRLVLLAPEGTARARVCQYFAGVGVAAERVMFVSRMGRREYLEQYQRIDIGLDTLPANGHTTSLDAYWMGVPVATMVGSTAVGRAGVSQLTNLGLTDLIAETPEQFVQHAVGLAADLPRLRELRATLRTRMERSPLMDRERFARHIEAAYLEMWQARSRR